MLVVIVAKTRMGGGACIGAIADDGRSVRLIAPDAHFNDHFNMEYNVGELWEIEADRPGETIPPHVENVIVRRKRLLRRVANMEGLVERHMPPRRGGPEVLYDGLLHASAGGALYVTEAGIPSYSTVFWRPDRPLALDTIGKRIHYRYPTDDGGRTLTFVGFQEPLEEIPAGALLRVSLAHWWRPEERPEDELRCYVQLSGWITPEGSAERRTQGSAADAPAAAATLQDARRVLKQVFGYDDFRPLQEPIIDNVMAKRDSLAIMPTGSGKSLCYQLPALLFPGLTVVVSPLISLMEDQVMQLRELGAPAVYLNSTLSYDAYLAATQQIATGQARLLYTAPETLLRPETLTLLDRCRVDCLTIDEAHCISEWGHDFRPEYRQLAGARRRLPGAVCLAVTATATERVRRDIRDSLEISDAAVFISSFDRENLNLAVEPRVNGLEQTLAFLEAHRGESGIIYCMTRESVDKLAATLNDRGWNALPYHAGMDNAARRANQHRFTYDEAPIIVATVAFGMGINKSNVRFILHYDLPKDLESYYQQIGRAGRDGLPADCLLLHSSQDVFTISFLIDKGDPTQRPAAMARLQAMRGYAETNQCRRRPLLAYFGEETASETCGRCDNCLGDDRERVDLSLPAQKFLSCAMRTRQLFGATYLIDILRGSRRREISERGHDQLSTYNIGGEYSKREWQQLARQFVSDGLLVQDMDHGSLRLTAKGQAVLKGEPYFGAPPEPAPDRPGVRTTTPIDYDVELFELLRNTRQTLARTAGVPPYVIFHDTTLIEMAHYYPQSAETLGQMQGVGATKLERYGDAFLSVIRAYCTERGLAEKRKPGATVTLTTRVSASTGRTRRDEVAELYNKGRSVGEIAEHFDVTLQTVISHLWSAVQDGATIAPQRLLADCSLSAETRGRVLAAFDELGAERLRPVYDALEEAVEWEQLHLLRLYYVATALRR